MKRHALLNGWTDIRKLERQRSDGRYERGGGGRRSGRELYWQNSTWSVNDLTAATNAPPAAGDPNGYAFTANGVSGMHVVYRGADNDIHELYWQNGADGHMDEFW